MYIFKSKIFFFYFCVTLQLFFTFFFTFCVNNFMKSHIIWAERWDFNLLCHFVFAFFSYFICKIRIDSNICHSENELNRGRDACTMWWRAVRNVSNFVMCIKTCTLTCNWFGTTYSKYVIIGKQTKNIKSQVKSNQSDWIDFNNKICCFAKNTWTNGTVRVWLILFNFFFR